MHLSSHHAKNFPVKVSSFGSIAAHALHAPARLAAVLLLTATLSTAAFAGSALHGLTSFSINIADDNGSAWSVPFGSSFLTVDPATGGLTMPAVGTELGGNWGWGKVNVLDQSTRQYVQKDAVTWHTDERSGGPGTTTPWSSSISIFATGNVDPFMNYAISARNNTNAAQTYTLHLGESIIPPIAPGTYGLYADIAGSISNGSDGSSVTIAPAVGSTIQKLGLSTDSGSSFFTAGVDLGAAQTDPDVGTTPYDFASVSGGGSTLSTINYWAFDVSFTLSPKDSAAISGFAEITQLTLIPEPSTYAALMGAVTLLGVTLRRRRQVGA